MFECDYCEKEKEGDRFENLVPFRSVLMAICDECVEKILEG